ncbi:MAG: DUF4091 domain-containing protein [Myxococcaceae bacterium]|nr:DUF4091 domain-containing protein [Myxococcaceae bacterium]
MKTTHKKGCLIAAATLLLSAGALAAPTVTTAPSSVKIRPDVEPPADTPAELTAAKNEFVSFQIVVRADDAGLQNVSASFSGLSGPGKIGADSVTLYREGYLDITQPSFPQAPTGRYPDPLIPDVDETAHEKRNAFPFNVPAHESRVIWVDVLVPKDAAPGTYRGTVDVTADGGFSQKVPVTLDVVNTELPSTSSLPSAFLFQWNMACAVHTGNSDCGGEDGPNGSYALRDKYVRLALDHRITLSNTMVYPFNGDWATFDKRYGPWLDGTAPTRLPGAKVTTTQYMGQRDAAQYAAYEEHMAAKGWLDRAYDYTGDEPPFGISFEEARRRAELVKSAAPNLRTLLTTTIQAADQNGLSPLLDLIVPVVNYIDGVGNDYPGDQRPAYDAFLSDPKNGLWLYQSCMSHGCAFGSNAPGNSDQGGWPSYMVDASAARNRAMQWEIFASRAGGELYYETALALDTAWDSVYRFAGNGDGTLFYPGLPSRIGGTTDVPLPSLRLKQIRQGMQDYEWLKKVADAGDPEFAMKVAKSVMPTAHQAPDDGSKFDTARKQLIARFLELQPQALPNPEHPSVPTLGNPAGAGSGGPRAGGGSKGGCTASGSPAAPALAILSIALSALLDRRRRAASTRPQR